MKTTVSVQGSRFAFEIARPSDDAELRRLVCRTPVEGGMRVTFEREPNFFQAMRSQGDFHEVGIARDLDRDRIIGMGTRSVSEAFVNGVVTPLGYLSDLRLDPEYRGGTLIARGYRLLHRMHQDGRTRLYFTVIFSDNEMALQTIAQGRAGLPDYHDLGLIHSPGINLFRRKPAIGFDGEIRRGTDALLPQIVDCLNRNNRGRQFAPFHRVDDFQQGGRWQGFQVNDFYVALRKDKVIGVMGKWDQRAFKQTRIIGYRGRLRWMKPLVNGLRPLSGMPRLPEPGSILPYFYACFIAIDNDDLNIFQALLRRIYNDAVGTQYEYFLAGMHKHDPLLPALKDYSLTPFFGRLFCVCYSDGDEAFSMLDKRCPYIEIALL